MSLRSRLPLLAFSLAVMLPLFGGVFLGTANAAPNVPPACYVQTASPQGTKFTKIGSCPADKLPGGKVEGNEGKCFVATGSSQGISDFKVTDCSSMAATSQGFTTNPAGDCGDDGSCSCDGNSGDCISQDIQMIVNALAIGVGIIVTIVIMVAGLQYMTSRDNPQAVLAAKMRIFNAVIALIAFAFIYTFLQWVVPGGIFSAALPLHNFIGIIR